jgi:hypothetical protein
MSCDNESKSWRMTWEGCSVLLDINDGDRLVFARLSPAASVSLFFFFDSNILFVVCY